MQAINNLLQIPESPPSPLKVIQNIIFNPAKVIKVKVQFTPINSVQSTTASKKTSLYLPENDMPPTVLATPNIRMATLTSGFDFQHGFLISVRSIEIIALKCTIFQQGH